MPIDREAVLRTAERLLRQGRLDGAIAEYVRLTDDQPRDFNSINTLGDLYVRAGDTDRAVGQFVRIADHLFDEGFLPKAAALYKKALKVKPDHEHTLLRLSDIAVQQGLLADAKLYLRQLAQQRQKRGDEQGAIACVIRLGEIDEYDGEAKVIASRAAQSLGNVPKALVLLQEAAAAFEKQKRGADAINALIAAAELAPDDAELRATVARTLLAAGEVERAQPFLSAATVGDDPGLLVAVARHDLASGRSAAGYAGLMRAVALAPDRQEQVEQLAAELLAADRVEDAYGCIDVLVDAALFDASFDRATGLLESFLAKRRVVGGLLKLVDIYVDAGRDDRITAVQEQLAEAYLDNGQAAEARIVAEDLIAREPHVEAHAQRLRRALTALGVEDIDEVIARQREVAPIFDELIELAPIDVPAPSTQAAAIPQAPPPAPVVASAPAYEPELPVDMGLVVEPREEPVKREPSAPPASAEIDLSGLLADLKVGTATEVRPAVSGPAADATDPAGLFERAQDLLRRGDAPQATVALEAAARSPQWRFKASVQLGRMAMSRGDVQEAVDWLERAASAPSPSPEDTCAVTYDLADALERAGEHVRALALFMELEADAGAFRDVRTRIDQLSNHATGVNGERA